MKYNLLRLSLLSMLAVLFGGGNSVLAAEQQAMAASADTQTGDITANWDFQNLKPASLASVNIQQTNEADVESDVEGIKMHVISNGGKLAYNSQGYAQFNTNTTVQIPVRQKGDIVTAVSYPGQSNYTVGGQDAKGQNTFAYTATASDATRGYVEIVPTATAYVYSFQVQLFAPKGASTLTDEPATATFPFHDGTEGQKATFSEADYFLSSKVTYGSNLKLDGKDNKQLNQTWFKPTEKESKAAETNAIRFLIQPKFGYTFTPTKVSFKSTRFGTNGGNLDIAWQNPDGTTVSLATEQLPNRDNASPNVSDYAYDITGATPGEGSTGLVINLYSLDNNKNVGFSDIVIEGTLSGTEKNVPVLQSFKLNGETYQVNDVFGEQYEASLELSKTVAMVSESNPLTDITATAGEVGTVTYQGDATHCTVTIPMTAADVNLDYVLNVVQKPDFTLTYLNTDGTTLGSQTVEKDAEIGSFAIDYAQATAAEGEKVRGWFEKTTGGRKFATTDIITADTKLYAVATEIEVSSNSKKYTFDLNNPYFYAEDHEAFNPTGKGVYHDATHGWVFSNGDKIDLLVGPKATISIAICAYSKADSKLLIGDKELNGVTTTDGEIVTYDYEGQAGTLTLTIQTAGAVYLHYVKITNTSEVNYESDGDWFFVKAGEADSFLDVLEAANIRNASASAQRSFIYLPNGTYNLGTRTLTQISGHNISIIGESQEGVTIKNLPEEEGIGVTATLYNTGTGNYLQDLTIKNDWDYYGGITSGAGAGRAVCFWDKGSKTTLKNVTLLSYQDTYYSANNDGQFYFEGCDVHGTVDFFCGGGTLFVESSTITVEKRNPDGKGECTITAPSTAAGKNYGYVFNNCRIENQAASYNLGRAWQNEPRCAWLNTTVNDNKIATARYTAKGMNVVAKAFYEYNTMDEQGNVVSPASNVIEFYYGDAKNKMETILSADAAANFTIDKVFANWAPTEGTTQLKLATAATLEGNVIKWNAVAGAQGYAIFEGDDLLTITDANTTSYTIEMPAAAPRKAEGTSAYTIRVVNAMGGMGEAVAVSVVDGIENVGRTEPATGDNAIYTLQGVRVDKATKGVYIIGGRKVVVK